MHDAERMRDMMETKPAAGAGSTGIATWEMGDPGDARQGGKPAYTTMQVSSAAASGSTPAFAAPGLTDPQAAQQWHLGKLGDIAAIWADYTGKGVKVGVYDSGVQYDHPDLAANYDASLELVIDGKRYDGDYVPASGPHGTAVAGLIAAARNGVGTVGIAYDAKVTGVNIFDPYSGGGLNPGIYINAADPALFFEAMKQRAKFDVVNDSWGVSEPNYSSSTSRGVAGTGANLTALAVEYAAVNGRGGLGTVSVAAAGNLPWDSQGDSSHTDRHWIAVGAYREIDGLASNYSAHGTALLVSAPSNDFAVIGGTGIVATDLVGRDGYNLATDPGGKRDYTDQFGGTSAASPITAGVVTLMLDANEGLGWRDVQNILAQSATMPIGFGVAARTLEYTGEFGPAKARMNEDVFKVTGLTNTNWNGGGLHHSNDYGYGAVNAYAAVRMAEVWKLFDTAQTSANEVHVETPVYDVDLVLTPGKSGDTDEKFNRFTNSAYSDFAYPENVAS